MQICLRAPLRKVVLGLSVLTMAALVAGASEETTAKPTDVPATVIAHLPLPQASGTQMLLQRGEWQTLPLCAAGREARIYGGGCFQPGET